MTLPFLQKSHAYAARLLHQAGLTVKQIPQAIEVTKTTVETWLQREMEKGNVAQAVQVLKGHLQEEGPKMAFDKLKELVLVKLIIHLGLKNNVATQIASFLLPFVLKRVAELAKKNPNLQNWWQNQTWRQRLPEPEAVKERVKSLGKRFTSSSPGEEAQALYI
ncbi:MAG: terminase gpP N-terminus-related DNA-binding protein [Rufibacter sp.]